MDFIELLRRVFNLNPEEAQELESTIDQGIPRQKRKQLERRVQAAYEDPPRIAIIGTTGVGKSSTINELFNPHPRLPVGHVIATTKRPRKMQVSLGGDRGDIIVIDFPGLSESIKADKEMIPTYKEFLAECDVAVYIFQADDRTLADDQAILRRILTKDLKKRLVIGLNKVDLLEPGRWLEDSNLPSREQVKSIETKIKDVKKKLKEVGVEPREIVPYSAKRGYRLVHLFKCMLEACPKQRAWVLDSRKEIREYQVSR